MDQAPAYAKTLWRLGPSRRQKSKRMVNPPGSVVCFLWPQAKSSRSRHAPSMRSRPAGRKPGRWSPGSPTSFPRLRYRQEIIFLPRWLPWAPSQRRIHCSTVTS